MTRVLQRSLKAIAVAAIVLAALYLVAAIYAAGETFLALACLVGFSLGLYVYLARSAYTWRYLFPGVAGMLVFVVFPLLYTVRIGFTNYSGKNLVSFDRATRYLLEQTVAGEGPRYSFGLYQEAGGYRLVLRPAGEEGEDPAGAQPAVAYASPVVALGPSATPVAVDLAPFVEETLAGREPLPLKELIQRRAELSRLELRLPGGSVVRMTGLREFAAVEPQYRRNPDGSLTDQKSGDVLRPDFRTGFYLTGAGEPVRPGFKVDVGLANYVRMIADPDFRGPFLAIFLWTVAFAGLTVLFTGALGIALAVLLNWEALRFRTLYRTLIFLPYAVPGFISILVFRGLFNQNFGEINTVLDHLFGLKPAWFADPLLAKCMILIVNTWLGYPYVMILCTGLIKAIPADLYEASAIVGAGPLTNFFKITAPLIAKPLTPLLVSSFAFNFNNFVLISLLTNGRPDFLNTKVPAGTTDILVSYTYRIAFQDSGQDFGLAAAISTVVFVLVAGLSVLNLKLTRAGASEAP